MTECLIYNSADSRFQATPQYNGNIQTVAWQVAGRAGNMPPICTNCSSIEGQDFTEYLNTFLNSQYLRNKFVPRDEVYDSVNHR